MMLASARPWSRRFHFRDHRRARLPPCYDRARLDQHEEAQVRFAVGLNQQGKSEHVIVDAEDALVAALKVKLQRQEAMITYVRRANKRGDTPHPGHGLTPHRK